MKALTHAYTRICAIVHTHTHTCMYTFLFNHWASQEHIILKKKIIVKGAEAGLHVPWLGRAQEGAL